VYEVALSGTLDLAELYSIPLAAGAVYVVDAGSELYVSVDSVTGVVTPLAEGTAVVLIQDSQEDTWQRVFISVVADNELQIRELIASSQVSVTVSATVQQEGSSPMTTDIGFLGGHRLIHDSVADVKLKTIASAGKVSNSATTATASNTASAIVARDADGKFSTAMISLTGTVTNSTDAATKAYVDSVAQGLDVKASVRAATTANITLSGEQTIDGVELVAGDRVLVKNQSTASANGIYVVAASTWSRATDADSSAKVSSGMFVFVEEGTANADAGFVLSTDGAITLGTTALAFVQFSGAGQLTAGAGLTKTGNTLDIVAADSTITVNGDSIQVGQIANANVASNAAIAYSKLNLAGSLVNADVSASAAIAYSKLALTGSIVNADISASAAIAYSKLALTGSLVNADIAAAAGIAYSKLALANSIVNADIAAAAAIAYSKLALTGSIVNADISATAAIADTKLATISTAGKVANSATTGTASAVADTLVLRDANGRAKVADPAVAADIASKGYVDTEIARFVINETPTGSINGTNREFTLAHTPASGTLQVFVSGLMMLPGTHFTFSGATLTFTDPYQPITGEWLRVSYKKA
jgi:hypothetical protein